MTDNWRQPDLVHDVPSAISEASSLRTRGMDVTKIWSDASGRMVGMRKRSLVQAAR